MLFKCIKLVHYAALEHTNTVECITLSICYAMKYKSDSNFIENKTTRKN